MSKALRSYNIASNLPVGEKLPGQVPNSTGGFVYQISDQSRLERFLILGTDGGTYYVSERDLTKQNIAWLVQLIQKNPGLVLSVVSDVSLSGRAFRNSAAIFTVALGLNHAPDSYKNDFVVLAEKVARTGTMVYELAQYIENLGGWGRAKRRAIANWFTSKTPDQLAYQAVKYRQRNGWTLKDLMRLSHPVGVDKNAGNFILGNYNGKMSDFSHQMPAVINGFVVMQRQTSVAGVLNVLTNYPSLPWETIPTEFLKDASVWKKLFYNGQLKGQAALRNVTRLEKIGAFADSGFRNDFLAAISDKDMMVKTRLHPFQYLNASVVYTEGSIDRKTGGYYGINRNKTWQSRGDVEDALKDGFYTSFKNVVPSGKKFLIGLDVSGSMGWEAAVGSDLTAAQAGAFMAMMVSRVEPDSLVYGFANTFVDLKIKQNDPFETVMTKVHKSNFGSTDMSLPMQFAKKNRLGSEVFIVITDNEINRGQHPSAVLKDYRSVVSDAKLVVMGVTSTDFSIADPSDHGMLDVVGFDSNAPKVISDFAAGRI